MTEMPDGPMKEFAERFRSFSFSLEGEIRQRIASLMGEQKLSRDELEIALRSLYWNYPGGIPDQWLWIAFGPMGGVFEWNEYHSIIQNYRYQFPCDECGTDVLVWVRDHEDADRFWGGITLLCPDCSKKRNEEKIEKNRRLVAEQQRIEREAKVAELRAMPYADYLQTEHWQAVRQATLKRDHNRCRLCRSTERLQVHHNTYERRGCEDPDDTVTLCGDCHQNFHDHRQLVLVRPQ